MQFLKIRNWEKYQHYTHRNPPWIKLHNQILDDYEYCCLQDDSKLLLVSLFLLASKTENKIPADHEWIRSKAMIKGKVDLSELIKSNFIEHLSNGLQDDSNMIAPCKQNGGTEKRRVDKIREDKYSAEFLTFYSHYPLKKSKQKAFQSWTKQNPDLQTCLFAIEKQINEKRVLREKGKFCPEWKHPATWLNQGCWEDETNTEPEATYEAVE